MLKHRNKITIVLFFAGVLLFLVGMFDIPLILMTIAAFLALFDIGD